MARSASNSKSEFSQVDKILMSLSLLVFCASSYLIFDDSFFNASDDSSNLVKVGQFANSQNDVRRKSVGGTAYSAVSGRSDVFEGDSIFTGEGSSAEVSLAKGDVLSLDAKSLIVVRTAGDSVELDLQYGAVSGKLAGEQKLVLINQQGEKSEISGTVGKSSEIRVATEKDKGTSQIQVLSGQVQMKNKKGESKVVSKNEAVEVSQSGEMKAKKIFPIDLTGPANNFSMWRAEDDSVSIELAWQSGEPQAKFVIELSADAGFAKPFLSKSVSGFSYVLKSLPLQTSVVYWRVHNEPTMDVASAKSAVRKFVVYRDAPLKLVQPATDQKFEIDTKNVESRKVVFAWADENPNGDYVLQIATDRDFKEMAMERKTKALRFENMGLSGGQYFWRVKGTHPGREQVVLSETRQFQMNEKAIPAKTPELVNAKIDFEIPSSKMADAIANKNEFGYPLADFPGVMWRQVDSSSRYSIEVSATDSFDKILFSQDLGRQTFFKPPNGFLTTYYYRVRSMTNQGTISSPSLVGVYRIGMAPPQIFKTENINLKLISQEQVDAAQAEFKLTWLPNPLAKSYELQWGADEQFTQAKTFEETVPSRTLKVTKAMTYYYRVRVLDENKKAITRFSDVAKVEFRKSVDQEAILTAQRLEEEKRAQEEKAKADKLEDERKAALAKVEAEKKLKAEKLAAEKAAKEKLAAEKLAAEKAEADRKAALAKIEADRKPAEDRLAGMRIPPPKTDTNLGANGSLPVPNLTEPPAFTQLVAIDGSASFVRMLWTGVASGKQYKIEIADNVDFERPIVSKVTRNTNFFLNQKLQKGTLYWRVRVEDGASFGRWSQTSAFVMK